MHTFKVINTKLNGIFILRETGKAPWVQNKSHNNRSRLSTVNIGYKNTPWDQREGVLIGESSYSQSIGYKNTLNTRVHIADVIGYKKT